MASAVLAIVAGALSHARANTGPCPYALSTGVATDANTSLTWQTMPPAGTSSFSQADNYCSTLPGTNPPWRLPTIRELQTLVHEGHFNPAIDTTTFTVGLELVFWASTPVAGQNLVWGVNFADGQVLAYGQQEMHAVRCVR
jgi:hypothetical protein